MHQDIQLFRIKYINKFNYIHYSTGSIFMNNMNKILFNINNEGLIIEILKQNIVELEPIKSCQKNLPKKQSIKLI